jgi:hypothetical protein
VSFRSSSRLDLILEIEGIQTSISRSMEFYIRK